jgi:hypothetical protein
LTFAATFRGKTVTAAPASIDVRADLGVQFDPALRRMPTLTFLLNPATLSAAAIDLSGRLRAAPFTAGHITETAIANMDFADLVRLVTAEAVGIDIFGVKCSIDMNQIEALHSFAVQIVPPRR